LVELCCVAWRGVLVVCLVLLPIRLKSSCILLRKVMLLLAWKELTWHAGTTTIVRRALGQFNGHDNGNVGAWNKKGFEVLGLREELGREVGWKRTWDAMRALYFLLAYLQRLRAWRSSDSVRRSVQKRQVVLGRELSNANGRDKVDTVLGGTAQGVKLLGLADSMTRLVHRCTWLRGRARMD
jgi:hypothetical protein